MANPVSVARASATPPTSRRRRPSGRRASASTGTWRRGGTRPQLRGGVGIFAGRTPYVWLSNQYGNTGVQFTNLSVTVQREQPDSVRRQSGRAAENGDRAARRGRQTINLIDPDYKYPTVVRSNLAIDHELGFLGHGRDGRIRLHEGTCRASTTRTSTTSRSAPRPDGRHDLPEERRQPERRDAPDQHRPGRRVDRQLQGGSSLPQRAVARAGRISYNDAHSITDGTSSVARSNWTTNPIGLDTNNPALTRSNYAAGNRINFTATLPINFGKGVRAGPRSSTTARTGRPYALVFNGDANLDSITNNDLMFVPASADQVNVINGTWEQLDAFLSNDPAASKSRGKIMERNMRPRPVEQPARLPLRGQRADRQPAPSWNSPPT